VGEGGGGWWWAVGQQRCVYILADISFFTDSERSRRERRCEKQIPRYFLYKRVVFNSQCDFSHFPPHLRYNTQICLSIEMNNHELIYLIDDHNLRFHQRHRRVEI